MAVIHSMCNIIPIILNLSKCFPLNNLHNFPRYYSPQENDELRGCSDYRLILKVKRNPHLYVIETNLPLLFFDVNNFELNLGKLVCCNFLLQSLLSAIW